MKKAIFILLTSFASLTVLAQNFEGKISYSNAYTSKKWITSDEKLNAMFGTKQDFFIKDGDYKSITNGTFQSTLYVNRENKLYAQILDNETIYWTDALEQEEKLINAKVNKNVTKILGYDCDEVILTYKSGTQTYYFSSQLAVDSKLYSKHKSGNWYDFLEQSNALPLKMIVDTDKFHLESIATAVTPMKMDASKFALPADAKTKKNPF